MLTVGDFYTDLRAMLKRGTSLDAELPGACRRAVRWIEQNHSLEYMRRRLVVDVAGGATIVALPSASYKAILSLGYRADGDWIGLTRRDFDTASRNDWGTPTGPRLYQLDGGSNLVLDVAPSTDLTLRGWWSLYSDWPSVPEASHWLLANAETLLRSQVMLEFALFNRDERSAALFSGMREEQIKVLQNAEYEARYANQDIVLGQE